MNANEKIAKIMAQAVASGLADAVKESSKEYGKKIVLGIGAEIAIYFGSKAIINKIEANQNKGQKVSAEA